MKRIITFCLFVLVSLSAQCQAISFFRWFSQYSVIKVTPALDGGHYMAASGSGAFKLYYITAGGDTLWSKPLPFGGPVEVLAQQAADSTLLITCNNKLIKTDRFGDTIWTKTIVQNMQFSAMDIAGDRATFAKKNSDILARYTLGGDTLWTRNPPGLYNQYIKIIHDSSYIYAIGNFVFVTQPTALLIKLDTLGNVLAQNGFAGSAMSFNFTGSSMHSNGYLYACGNGIQPQPVMVKLNTNCDTMWTRSYPTGIANSRVYAIAEAVNGDLLMCGVSDSGGLVVRADSAGNFLWMKHIDVATLLDIYRTPDNGFMIQGTRYIPDTSSVLIKLDPLGNLSSSTITGNVFTDVNQNGIKDAGDVGVRNQIVSINPQGSYAITDSLGNYRLEVYDTGQFTIALPNLPSFHQIGVPATGTHIINIPVANTALTGNNFTLNRIPGVEELEVNAHGNSPRQGMNSTYNLLATNRGTQTSLSPQISLHFDPRITVLSSNTPYTISGNTIIWSLDSLVPNSPRNISVSYLVPSTVALATLLQMVSNISIPASDTILSNNTDTVILTVVASYDPNNKLSYSSTQSPEGYFTEYDLIQEYVINFQNTGNDTAFTVLLTDTIDQAVLDFSTLQVIGASHNYKAAISNEGVLSFRFDNILLPDSTTNEPRSKGFVRFHISARQGMAHLTHVRNMAGIYFDFNTVVNTNSTDNIFILCDSTNKFTLNGNQFCELDTVEATYTGIAAIDLTWNSAFTQLSTGVTQQYLATTGSVPVILSTQFGNCVRTTSQSVTVAPTTLIGLVANTSNYCNGDTAILIASATPTQWYWNGTPVSASGNSLRVTDAGRYYTSLTGTSCPAVSDTLVISFNPLPAQPTVTGDLTICQGDTTTLSAPSGFTYLWSNGASTQTINVTSANSFTVQVTDANNCESPASIAQQVIVNSLPAQPSITGDLTICQGDTTTLSAPSGFTYLWSNGASTQSINVTSANSYTVQVTDANNCESPASAAQQVVVNSLPAQPSITGDLTICQGDTATLSAPAGFTYLWSNGASTQTINVTSANSFTVQVTDANNCESPASAAQQVVVNPLPLQPVITADGPTTFCHAGSVEFSAPSGYVAYSWSNGSTAQSITVDSAGIYTVVVTDANNCTSPVSTGEMVTINGLVVPEIIVSGTSLTCTTPADSYQWYLNGLSLPEYDQSINITENGEYTVNVIVDNCVSVISAGYVGIDDVRAADFRVFPNPNNGRFEIVFDPNTIQAARTIRIINALGAAVSLIDVSGIGGNNVQIDISAFAKGLYLLTVETTHGVKYVRVVYQ